MDVVLKFALSLSLASWTKDALCLEYLDHVDWWFPTRGESAEPAKSVCARCAVRAECLDYALRIGEEEGVWGGMSGRQRRQMREARAAA